MAFLRLKVNPGNQWQLVESYRRNGQVKQRVLKNYGKLKPTPEQVEQDKQLLKGRKG